MTSFHNPESSFVWVGYELKAHFDAKTRCNTSDTEPYNGHKIREREERKNG